MSFLAIDIGNTRMKWALYSQPLPGAAIMAHGAVFLETIDRLAEGDWKGLPAPRSMLGCVVAGEGIKRRVEEQLELWDLAPRWVVPAPEGGGIRNGYDHPNRLGSDRYVALIGARQRALMSGWKGPVLVVMIGTAATVDAIDENGNFLGGLILPGHGIMLRALETGTAGLHVPTGQVTAFPKNTSDALTSGGTYAITGAILRMHKHLQDHTGQTPMTIMTGGAGWKVAPYLDLPHQLIESLIFDGLLTLQSHRLAL